MTDREEDIGKAVLKLVRRNPDAKVYRGMVTTTDEHGRARRVPWYDSITDREGRIKQGDPDEEPVLSRNAPERFPKRTHAQRAEDIALRFVGYLKKKEQAIGRPLVPDDLTAEETRAFGIDLWLEQGGDLAKAPPDVEFFKMVAGIYLATEGKVDPRFTPSGRGYEKPRPEQA